MIRHIFSSQVQNLLLEIFSFREILILTCGTYSLFLMFSCLFLYFISWSYLVSFELCNISIMYGCKTCCTICSCCVSIHVPLYMFLFWMNNLKFLFLYFFCQIHLNDPKHTSHVQVILQHYQLSH